MNYKVETKMVANEDVEAAAAQAEAWNHCFGFIKASVVKSAVDLDIPDILEKHAGAPLSLSDLSSAVGCPADRLYRIMRFLAYHGIFKIITHASASASASSSVLYAQTPISRCLTKDNLGPFLVLLGSLRDSTGCLTAESLKSSKCPGTEYSDPGNFYDDPFFSTQVFRDAMACHARLTTSAMIANYGEKGFGGVGSVVDVGGSHGMSIAMLVKAFPSIHGICFDLPHVVAAASPLQGVDFVAGSMFETMPKADAVMLMFVLHNWGDKECVDILKKCKEAVPAETGKVIIVDTVIDEDGKGDEFAGARLGLDMTMMAVMFEGKERTYREWAYILKEAGFARHDVKNIKALESVIEAYP